jgi:hypothetical protein
MISEYRTVGIHALHRLRLRQVRVTRAGPFARDGPTFGRAVAGGCVATFALKAGLRPRMGGNDLGRLRCWTT